MPQSICFPVAGTLGNIVGGLADGVLVGKLTATAPTKFLTKSLSAAALCFTDDGGLYVDETAAFASATADDVEVLPATPAVEDAIYYGHATAKFSGVSQNITTAGVGTWTIVHEYWNGTAFAALADVVDGTTAFTAATGWHDITFTVPTDWEKCLVDGVNGYYIRARVTVYSAVTTAPQVGQGHVTAATPIWSDDTTDFNDADAGDVDLLPTVPALGDAAYIGYSSKFCKIKLTTSQARTGTATISLMYWNGTAEVAVPVANVDDDSAGYSATAGTHYIHFIPPTDWVAYSTVNGPNGNAGYFVSMELTALTDVTQQPKATRGWVLPCTVGDGVRAPESGNATFVNMSAGTVSGSTTDSKFILVNITTGAVVPFTWTKALASDEEAILFPVSAGNQLALAQITEDGSTEFANASFWLCF